MVADDAAEVARLLGRPPSGPFTVVVRRADGTPSVIENDPWLADGVPMPTRWWLVDPELRAAVSRLESAGGVRQAAAEVDPSAVTDAHRRYADGRDSVVGALVAAGRAPAAAAGRRPSGGVGGTRRGVKCLHAHLAWWLVGGDDPVGAWTAARLGIERSGSVVSGSL